MEQDKLLNDAIKFARQEGKVSVSKLQLRFTLGYHRATKIMKQIEATGILDEKNNGKYYNDRIVVV